jgi:hypothetical protein
MRNLVLLLSLSLGAASYAEAAPRLTLSALQIHPGDSVSVKASGFTPDGSVLSHLVRPDRSEYPEMTFIADPRGEFSHVINIIPYMTGTYELQMVDVTSKAVTSTRFFMLAVGNVPLPKSQAERTPPAYVGVWQGSLVQKEPARSPSALIALAGGEPGGVVGTIAYPSLTCGGELWLLGVYGESIELAEMITYGEERCGGRGTITATLGRDGALQFQWRDATRPGGATGTLPRRGE